MDKKPITGARIFTMPTPTGTTPAMIYNGDVPEKGDVLQFAMSNGVTYSGTVADATEADATEAGGETLVEFTDGLTPSKPSLQRKI